MHEDGWDRDACLYIYIWNDKILDLYVWREKGRRDKRVKGLVEKKKEGKGCEKYVVWWSVFRKVFGLKKCMHVWNPTKGRKCGQSIVNRIKIAWHTVHNLPPFLTIFLIKYYIIINNRYDGRNWTLLNIVPRP